MTSLPVAITAPSKSVDGGSRLGRCALACASLLAALCAFRVQRGRTIRLLWRYDGRVRSLCPIRRATGHRCPGCGMTRAVGLLAHSHPVEATHLNPGVWLLALLLASPRLPRIVLDRMATSRSQIQRPILRR